MSKIIIIEGVDSSGKTTLARKIQDETKGHLLHCTWDKKWGMQDYFELILDCAYTLAGFQTVVIDRWSPSEWAYGHVYRDGPQFDVVEWMKTQPLKNIQFVYCHNQNVVARHKKLRETRDEMYESIEGVQEQFDEFVKLTPFLGWVKYDFEKNNVNELMEKIL